MNSSGHFLLFRRLNLVSSFALRFLFILSYWLVIRALVALVMNGVEWCLWKRL